MAKAKTGLAAKLGVKGKKAMEKVRGNETRYSAGGDLPPGINNGIAELTECKFGVYEKGDNVGEYFFYAHGAVKSPKKHKLPDGSVVPIEGQLTKIGPIALCDTVTSRGREVPVEEALDRVLNEMRKLGYDTSDLDVSDLENAVQELKEAAPVFRFRTWASAPTEEYPNPRTNHVWEGVVDEAEGGEEDDDEEVEVEDEEVEAEEEEEEVEDADGDDHDLEALGAAGDNDDESAQFTLTKLCGDAGIDPEDYESWTDVAAALAGGDEAEAEEEEAEYEEVEEEGEEDDLVALGEAADAEDEEAITALTEAAEEAGLDPDEFETWTELAEAIQAGGEEEEEEEEFEPEVDEVYFYKAPGTRKAVACTVKKVLKTKQTCNLRGNDNNRVYNGVPWSKLQAEE